MSLEEGVPKTHERPLRHWSDLGLEVTSSSLRIVVKMGNEQGPRKTLLPTLTFGRALVSILHLENQAVRCWRHRLPSLNSSPLMSQEGF